MQGRDGWRDLAVAPVKLPTRPCDEGRVDVNDVDRIFGMKPKQRPQGMAAKGARERHGCFQPRHADDANA